MLAGVWLKPMVAFTQCAVLVKVAVGIEHAEVVYQQSSTHLRMHPLQLCCRCYSLLPACYVTGRNTAAGHVMTMVIGLRALPAVLHSL
jgi:hypothetical protein